MSGIDTIAITTRDGQRVTATPEIMEAALDQMHGRKPKKPKREAATEVGGIAADRLRSIIERIERLQEERKSLGDDIKDIFHEAKGAGFDVKVIRQVIRIRQQEPADVEEFETLLDLYRRALGM